MYNYKEYKKEVFTEEGQEMFLSIRDRVHNILQQSGAITMAKAIYGESGDNWKMLACVDRLVELGEIKEISSDDVWAQNRVFISNRHRTYKREVYENGCFYT